MIRLCPVIFPVFDRVGIHMQLFGNILLGEPGHAAPVPKQGAETECAESGIAAGR